MGVEPVWRDWSAAGPSPLVDVHAAVAAFKAAAEEAAVHAGEEVYPRRLREAAGGVGAELVEAGARIHPEFEEAMARVLDVFSDGELRRARRLGETLRIVEGRCWALTRRRPVYVQVRR